MSESNLKHSFRMFSFVFSLLSICFLAQGSEAPAHSQERYPDAPEMPKTGAEFKIDWGRFERLAEVAREVPPAPKLVDVVRGLRAAIPAEAGRLSPLDWFSLCNIWSAVNYPSAKGKTLTQETSVLSGDDLYALLRKGYRLNREQSVRVQARLLTLAGIPSEPVTGLVRNETDIERGAWVVCQVGKTRLRVDLQGSLPVPKTPGTVWHPSPYFFQENAGIEGMLQFLRSHLPDGESSARQQGLKSSFTVSEWETWERAEAALKAKAKSGETPYLFASRIALVTPNPLPELKPFAPPVAPPHATVLTAMERLRRKPLRSDRGAALATFARKFAGLPYVWGGESPDSGFDCSGLVQYVFRSWGVRLPRTAAEQHRYGRPVSFLELEPGDLVFLSNTYKPGVSHVGIYIGEGLWVQAASSAIGVIVSDVPYFEPGIGPGARRMDLSRSGAAEPTIASRSSERQSNRGASAALPGKIFVGSIITIKICGDSGGIANSGCDNYKSVRVSKAQGRTIPPCRRHRPRSGEGG